jgi:hypothetical protein
VHSSLAFDWMWQFLYWREKSSVFTSCTVTCLLADGQRCEIIDVVKLHVKLLSFSWDYKFKVLREGNPFLPFWFWTFLGRTKMLVDVVSRKFCFRFVSSCTGTFSVPNSDVDVEP